MTKVSLETDRTLRLITPAESERYGAMSVPESTAQRVKRLQAEARSLALEEIVRLENLLLEAAKLAREIADGGDAYPVGVREMASRIHDDLPNRAETIKLISARA